MADETALRQTFDDLETALKRVQEITQRAYERGAPGLYEEDITDLEEVTSAMEHMVKGDPGHNDDGPKEQAVRSLREDSSPDVVWITEPYKAEVDTSLLTQLYLSGLMAMCNVAVLHPHGFALGVSVEEDGTVSGLNLHHSDDPEGIWLDEALTRVYRQKMLKSGILLQRGPA